MCCRIKRLKHLTLRLIISHERGGTMEIPIKLQMLIDDVLGRSHTDKEWLELESEVVQYLDSLSDELQDAFAESGAGETLHMVCSGIRAINA